MSSDQGWTSFQKIFCQMRSYWAQLAIISISEFGMVDEEPENMMTICESSLVGFLFSSLSVIEWFWAWEWIECCLKCGWVSTALHLLSALHWLSSADSSKKLVYWLSMKYHLKMQSSNRRVKRWFYIIISLAITVCSCTELIQLSLLLLLRRFKEVLFLRKTIPILEELNSILEKKMLTQIRKRLLEASEKVNSVFYLTLSSTFPWEICEDEKQKYKQYIENHKKVKRETEVICVIEKYLEM